MKLAKKVLACVVAFALMSVLAISAFAANATLGVSAPATAEIGQTITVVGKISGANDLQSATFAMHYDPEYLEFVSATAVDGGQSGLASDGLVTDALAYSTNAGYDAKDLLTVTFKVLKDNGSTEVTFDVLDEDISGLDGAATGAATIKFQEKATAAPITTAAPTDAPTGDATTAPTTKTEDKIPQTGDAGIAVAAGLVVLAGAAFVASKKTK